MKLSEMRQSPDVGRPVKEHRICVAGKLVRELEASDLALSNLVDEIDKAEKKAESPTSRRLGSTGDLPDLRARAEEQARVSDEIRARMDEHTVTLTLQSKDSGEWRTWTMKHPARDREADPQSSVRDLRWAAGHCNIDELIGSLGDFVVKYGDEDPTPESWPFVASNATSGDLTKLASVVVQMHEQVVDAGKSRSVALLNALTSDDTSE